MNSLLLLAPLFLLLEGWQLVMGERYLGIKQIARNADPRTLGLHELTAFFWTVALVSYAGWTVLILTVPFARAHALALLGTWGLGFAIRRNVGLKWVLVVLTIEGAIRVGLLVSLIALAWRRA